MHDVLNDSMRSFVVLTVYTLTVELRLRHLPSDR